MEATVARTRVQSCRTLAALFLAILIVLAAGAMPAHGAAAQAWWVAASGNDSNPGTSSAAPFRTITHALSVASAGDAIMIGPSVYSTATGETLPLNSSGVSLKSTDGSATTIIDGGGFLQGLTLSAPLENVEVRGLTVRNCSNGPGAAIMSYGSTAATGWPRIVDNGFVGNHEPNFSGAGIYIFSDAARCAPRIENNLFASNEATVGSGGALHLGQYIDATVTGNIFIGNRAYGGGAIKVQNHFGGHTEIRHNRFEGNHAEWVGGAIHFDAYADTTLTVSANTFVENEAVLGGALRLDADKPGLIAVTDNDASENDALDGGGFAWVERGNVYSANNAVGGSHAARGAAWYLNGGTFTARNDTIVGSQNASCAIDAHEAAELDIANCIVWNPLLPGDVEHADSVSYSCLHDVSAASRDNTLGAGMVYSDPLFADPSAHTIDLVATSPCIDAANTGAAPALDFYGTMRPIDCDGNGFATADIGAFERKTSTLVAFSAPSTCYYGSVSVTGTVTGLAGVGLPGLPVLIEYSYDNFGSVLGSATATTTASGGFSRSFGPTRKTYFRVSHRGDPTRIASNAVTRAVLPKVYLPRPSAKSTMTYGKPYAVTGYLKPRHASGTKPVRVQLYRYKNKKWVLSSKHYHAKVKNYKSYSKYSVSVKLPVRGKWRIKAYHPTDSLNASTTSAYRSVRVK